jgi:hypothetical protein
MQKLFLLKPDFQDVNRADGKSYFCPDCAILEGLLSFYPWLREKLEVHYLDFSRPRKVLVDLLGEANQSCPVLVLTDGSFINQPDDIIHYLVDNYQIGHPH